MDLGAMSLFLANWNTFVIWVYFCLSLFVDIGFHFFEGGYLRVGLVRMFHFVWNWQFSNVVDHYFTPINRTRMFHSLVGTWYCPAAQFQQAWIFLVIILVIKLFLFLFQHRLWTVIHSPGLWVRRQWCCSCSVPEPRFHTWCPFLEEGWLSPSQHSLHLLGRLWAPVGPPSLDCHFLVDFWLYLNLVRL